MSVALAGIDPARYVAHPLHARERHWPETNCYVDLWIEALHSLDLDPTAALAFTVGLDFEGDQFTFYKFPLADLQYLYGIEVRELNIWRPLLEHAREQVAMGRLFIMDVDSWFLPDTAGVSYHREHVKTAIAVERIDDVAHVLGYFHGTGYQSLAGDDFDGVFRLGEPLDAGVMPPYVEIAKVEHVTRHTDRELAWRSLRLLRQHLSSRPRSSPLQRYRARIAAHIDWLRDQPAEVFHQYAFTTLRQLGSCFGLTQSYLRWLAGRDEAQLERAIAASEEIATSAKALQFLLARAVQGRKDVRLDPLFDQLETSWATVMGELDRCYGS